MKRNLLDTARITFVLVFIMVCAIASYGQLPVAVPDGYATLNGGTTGGGNATPITVTTASSFQSAVNNNNPAVIIVDGRLNVGNVDIGSNKTIIGADTSSGLYGGTVEVGGTNYIFQNLTIGPADGDTMEVSGATNVFIHKCEFYDSTDELCSIVREADYVTVSWCKFYFSNPGGHAFAHLIGNSDDVIADRGKLHVTLHHNWYAENVRGRMPRVRFGHVHIYNNYYNSEGNVYCIGIGVECHIRLENTHFDNVNDPWADYGGTSNGEIGWSNLIFEGCSQPTFMPNAFPVFAPPYPFTLDSVEDVKSLVTDPNTGAGNCLPSSGATMWPYGDFTGNHIVDLNDMPDFLSFWLVEDCCQTEGVDLDDDCLVNFYEFSALAENWRVIPPDIYAPRIPSGLWAMGGDTTVSLDWDDNTEADFSGYNVYCSTISGDDYNQINSSLVIDSNYTDDTVSNGTLYFYVVTAVDTSENESNNSEEVGAFPSADGNSIIIQENTPCFCEVYGTVDDDYAGYTGDGYANTDDDMDRSIRWSMYAASAGTYTFTWRYANGSSHRPAHLYINGSLEASWFNFPGTGEWENWSEVSVSIPLTIGTQDIFLTSALFGGLANIDYLMVTGPEPQAAASCP